MVNILLVEDNPGFSKALGIYLEDEGHHVVTAHTLEAALKEISGNIFDVLISDTDLTGDTDSTDGIIVAKAFRKQNPTGTVIGMSSVERPEWKGYCDIFLEKSGIAKKLEEILNHM